MTFFTTFYIGSIFYGFKNTILDFKRGVAIRTQVYFCLFPKFGDIVDSWVMCINVFHTNHR